MLVVMVSKKEEKMFTPREMEISQLIDMAVIEHERAEERVREQVVAFCERRMAESGITTGYYADLAALFRPQHLEEH